MKKFIAVFLAVAFAVILTSPVCYGAVGYKKDGTMQGAATDIDFRESNTTFDGSTVTVFGNGYKDGVSTVVTGSVSNLTAEYLSYGVLVLSNLGAMNETGGTVRSIALANGTPGQMLTIIITAATGGTLYITDDRIAPSVFTMTKTGWDDIALNAALDSVTLLYVDDTYGWIVVGGNSVTIT